MAGNPACPSRAAEAGEIRSPDILAVHCRMAVEHWSETEAPTSRETRLSRRAEITTSPVPHPSCTPWLRLNGPS